MKALYFDCFSGISGDMAIGALLDLGVDRERFLEELSRLELDGYSIEIEKKTVNGISGTDVNVILDERGHKHDRVHSSVHGHDGHGQDHEHDYEHVHDHDRGHSQSGDHEHMHEHAHGERGLADIERIIDRSGLKENIKALSKKVFREIAGAEARVHGKSVNEVHFHEVGAVDSIVDIVGTAICLDLLGVRKVYGSVLHDGRGFIECRHGIIPVPVPAVMEMLAGSGIPIISVDVETELVTPTGMALIKCLASGFGPMPAMKVERVGYGHGKRNTGRLNALRVVLGEIEDAADTSPENGDEVVVLETNIDDTTPEILGHTISRLLEAGALDAFFTPVFMKKNRPAYMLTVLAGPGDEDALASVVLSETSTLGIRKRRMERYCMERGTFTVETGYGPVRVKTASYGNIRKASPEYEDCRNVAMKSGLPLIRVYELAKLEAARRLEL